MFPRLALVLAAALPQEAAPAPAPPAPFEEVGARALPGVATTCGGAAKDWIVEVNGGGVVLGDFDGDGRHDVVIVDGSTIERVHAGEPGLPPRLYLNRGAMRFEPAGEPWRMSGGRWGMGGAAGDVDGDGDLDLVVTEWGRDRLFANREGAGLAEVAESGLAGERWGTSAAFLDHDRDGFLDLAVVNYLAFDTERVASRASGECRWKGHAVMCGPEGLVPEHDQLYHNRGDGRFEDVSVAVGFRPERAGFGLGVITLDVDDDGDTDLYVANDSTPNHLWENRGAEGFLEVGLRRGVAVDANGREQAGMGIACGDLDGAGPPEIFVTNFSGESNALYVAGESGRWRERSAPSGLGGPSLPLLGWGAVMEDVDLDGDLDLAVFDGHVYPQADEPGTDTSYAQPDLYHENRGGLRFSRAPLSDARPSVSRAAAAADLDGDGRVDLVALDLGGPVRVLRNRTGALPEAAERHWLRVRLAGRGANTQGLGARVVATTADGVQRREIRTSGGFQAAVPAEAAFGLGDAERVQRLEVRWPSGRTSVLEDLSVDRVLVVPEPAPEGEGEGEGER